MAGGYARISHGALTSEKVNALLDDPGGLAAFGLWVAATVTSSRDLLDGKVPFRALRGLVTESKEEATCFSFASLVAKLVACGLASTDGSNLLLVGYADHNATRASVEAISEKRKKAGALGGKQLASRLLEQNGSKPKQVASTALKQPISTYIHTSGSDLSEISDPDLSGDPTQGPAPPAKVDPAPLPDWLDDPQPSTVAAAVDAEVRSLAKRVRTLWRDEFRRRSDWEWHGLHDGPEFERLAAWCVPQARSLGVDAGRLAEGVVLGFFATRQQRSWNPKWLNDRPERYAQAYAEQAKAGAR